MQERTLKIISVITMVVGLTFLFFYVQQVALPLASDLEEVKSSERVLMRGSVRDLQVTDKAVFFRLEGEKVIQTDVILFPENSIYLREGDHIEIIGQIEEYKGEKEVIADKIVLK